MNQELAGPGQDGSQVLDELQRGTETPPSVETMEGAQSAAHGERRGIPVPHPGDRPGAVRADQSPAAATPPTSGVLDEEDAAHDD